MKCIFAWIIVAVLFGLISCEKPSREADDSENCCLPPLIFEGPVMDTVIWSPQWSSQEAINPYDTIQYRREFIVMPSAFTPDSNGINDIFRVYLDPFYYLDPDTVYYADTVYYFPFATTAFNYELTLKIKLGNWEVFHSQDTNSPAWDGKCPDDVIRPGVYKAELSVKRDGAEYQQLNHYFRLLLPKANGNLDEKYRCMIFNDQFDSRYGLKYKTRETFE